VRDQVLDVLIEGGPFVEHRLAGERRGGGVLHAAEDEVRDEDLAVARERVGDADGLAEEVDHGGRGLQAALDVGFAPLGAIEVHIHPGLGRAGLELGELAAHQGHEVGRMGDGLGVVPQHPAVAELAPLAELTVRQHEQAGRGGAQHLARRFHEGSVHAREVVA